MNANELTQAIKSTKDRRWFSKILCDRLNTLRLIYGSLPKEYFKNNQRSCIGEEDRAL